MGNVGPGRGNLTGVGLLVLGVNASLGELGRGPTRRSVRQDYQVDN